MKYTSFIFAGLITCMGSCARHDSAKKVTFPTGYIEQLNVVYTEGPGWQQKMDLYLAPKEKGPAPIVINIHGGGWNQGTKESQKGFASFFKAGFSVANIEYRLTSQAKAPAAVEDARCALIYIIKNAAALNVDVTRIVIMGGSAGAHLALMAGLLGNDHRFDANCAGVENIHVAAIIDKYGITDVNDWAYGPRINSKSAIQWLGDKAKDEAFIKSVSPISYVDKNSPPVFIVHGDADPVVPYEESVELHKKLEAAGVKTVFITVPGGKHGQFPADKHAEMNNAIIKFLKELQLAK
jgi:acetyl esterase/lipase